LSLRFLLDTGTISRAQGPAPDKAVVGRLERVGAEAAIASVVLHELLYGVVIMPAGRRRANLKRFLESAVRPVFAVLPYDEPAAEWHARERGRLERIGRTPPFRDGQIAAVAAVNGLTVVTANVLDFEPFEGVTIEDWSTRS
jgi:tRNA(fMet)-specific endonuclease VapC